MEEGKGGWVRRISRRRRLAICDERRKGVCSVVKEQGMGSVLLSGEDGVGKPLLRVLLFNVFFY